MPEHNLPFLGSLQKYLKERVYPFHTPGHKGGRGALPALRELLAQALEIDVSLMGELDDLHNPQGALREAQQAAARLYGAARSFFAVNGTSGALQALLLGTLAPGDTLLLARNAHRSVVGALVLTGARPVYVLPEMEPLCGIAAQPTAASVAEALHKESCRAALLTSPNYYGLAAPLAAIAEAVHAHGALLLVDEAHGAHLGFSGKLPPSALSCGADAAAQSAHKLLGALTQASLLHLRGEGIDQEKVAQAMSLLTTTSPSHLLLASLDAACCQLAQAGAAMSDKALSLALYLREGLAGIAGLQVLDLPGYTLDRTKVTVNVAALNLTGFAAAAFLRQKKIAVELADAQNILYLITYADDKAAIDASIAALKELAAARRPAGGRRPSLPYPPLPETALLPREAFYQGREAVPLAQATGRVAAQEITFCPPGIPLLLPGERISQEIVEYIEEQARFHESDAWRYVSVVR